MPSRLGYNYYPDQDHYRREDAQRWMPILKSLGASWLVLRDSPDASVGFEFLDILRQQEIEPIVHIPGSIQSFSAVDIDNRLIQYAQMGLTYVVLGDRPNLRSRWSPSEWSRPGFIERYIDRLLPLLGSLAAAGLKPILPPAEPGGDYWDTAFLRSMLDGLVRRAPSTILDNLILGIYLWTYEKPLGWGVGGPEAWPETRAYFTPDGMQDQLGFHLFDWYSSIASASLGRDLPMICLGGGAKIPQTGSHDAEEKLGNDTIELAKACKNSELPAFVLNFSFYHLASDKMHPEHRYAWFQSDTLKERAVVRQLREYLANADGPDTRDSNTAQVDSPYLLIPKGMAGIPLLWNQDRIQELLYDSPRIGYSIDDALRSKKVIMLQPDSASHDSRLEQRLRHEGIAVELLSIVEDQPMSMQQRGPSAYDDLIENIRQGASYES